MRSVLTLARFHLLSVWNWRSAYISRLIEAPAYFLFMVIGLTTLAGERPVDGMRYVDFAFAGVLTVIAIRSLFWSMGDVANDRKWGTYAISRLSRVSFAAYLGSVLVANGLVALAQVTIIGMLKQALGHGDARDLWTVLLAFGITLVAILAGCALGFAVDGYNKRDLLTSLFSLPLVLTAPLFYSLDSVPGYLKVLAALNPFTYGVLLIRAPASGQSALLPAAGCAAAVLLIAGALVVASRRHELISREQG